jgi:serine/threonine protein kinase
MDGQLKNGTIMTSESGNKYTVVKLLGAGGQGEVYDVECQGKHYALKWYFKGSATARQKKMLETIIAKGAPDDAFLWPMELIVPTQGTLFGYVMPLRPTNYKSIVDLMKKKVNPSFYALCRTAFNLTKGYQKLHGMGAKYQDISFGNLFFNPDNGDVLICDNDNVSFDSGKPGGVLGTPGFMAPEIVRGEKRPSRETDRYSLSVLLFYLFMVNHPLDGKLEASIKCMDYAARVKLYGTDPVFIFDPDNKTNRPVKGIHDNANIYWPLYPEKMRQMFTKAFTVGLNEPSKRITEPEWMTLFANMMSGMLQCSCGASVFYDEDLETKGAAHICWNCQKTVQVPPKMIIGKSRIVLKQNTKLYHHHVYGDFDMETVVGSVVQSPNNPSLWGIRNEDAVNWAYEKPDGTQIPVEIGKTAGIAGGVKIHFSETIGEFK